MPNANQTTSNTQPKNNIPAAAQQNRRNPNEISGIAVQAHFKIFDPENKKVFVEGRA